MKNRLIVFLLALVVLASIPYEALAQRTITLENNSSYKLYVAMHYKHSASGWLTQGWWSVDANSKRDINIATTNNIVYLFAKNAKADLLWSGEKNNKQDASFYVVSDAFKALVPNRPSGKNPTLERFIYVEFTGDQLTYEFEN